ncbi:N-acetyltransferase [Sphingomonas sp. RHCKR7]|uniref:GNAT family N-acetyltransferase n=1 Tax=Sphingomonas folli TaxID=2862497 RepID=UPI001C6761DB|nr:N-acetyltransferase [Sphingomonas folli]MBW6528838.1 N-acetyltransferase [Sphingomonas folli]
MPEAGDTAELIVRPARGEDVAGIDSLLRACFARADEADLVRQLCVDGAMVLMMVALDGTTGAIVGAVAFSRMAVTVDDRAIPAVALAPLAVSAAYRRRGVGEALVQAGLDRLEAERAVLCFVLGDPGYYRRFGFHEDYARNFVSPYAGDALLALPLQGGLMPCGVRGDARHADAFAMLGAG